MREIALCAATAGLMSLCFSDVPDMVGQSMPIYLVYTSWLVKSSIVSQPRDAPMYFARDVLEYV